MAERNIDWEGIERDYRAGIDSLREIATNFSVTEGAIRKRAKRDGWERDLAAKVRAQAESLVRKAEVRSEVRKDPITEREIVQANATKVADIQIAHRRDITRMRALVLKLLEECELEAADPKAFAELGLLLRAEDDKGVDKLNDAYHKAISLPSRIKGVKELAETMKVLVGLEREAYGLGSYVDPEQGKNSIDPLEGARRLAFIFAQAANDPKNKVASHG